MKKFNSIDPALWKAYEETHFIVHSTPEFVLNIGQHSEELRQLFTQHKLNAAAFITAYNPFSQQLSHDENLDRQANLVKEIQSRGLNLIQGLGQDPDHKWKGEPSVLVLGIAFEAAKKLARTYEQNAFVWCDEACTPQLIASFDQSQ
jgi:hypothetical protein